MECWKNGTLEYYTEGILLGEYWSSGKKIVRYLQTNEIVQE